MGYTPSGISRMITALEDAAGFKLLIRTQNGVSATNECRNLLPVIREIVRAEERYFQEADEIKGIHTGSLVIGTSMDIFFPILSDIASEFTKEYPGVSIEIIDGISTKLSDMIKNHQLDLAIISKRDGSFRWIGVLEDELVAMVQKDSKYDNLDSFPISLFQEEPYIDIYHSNETDNSLLFEQNNIKPNFHHSCANSYAASAMIEAGLGITSENRIIADRCKDRVKLLPLEPRYTIEIGIAAPEKEQSSPVAERFLNYASERILKDYKY